MSTRFTHLLSFCLLAACVATGCGPMPPARTADGEAMDHEGEEGEEGHLDSEEEGHHEDEDEGAGAAEQPAPRSKMTDAEVKEQLEAWSHCGETEQPRLCVVSIRAAEADEMCEGDTLCERRNLNRQQARESLDAYEEAKQQEAHHPNPDARPKLSAAELEQRQTDKKSCGFDNECHRQKLAEEADELCGDDFDCHERNTARTRARSQ